MVLVSFDHSYCPEYLSTLTLLPLHLINASVFTWSWSSVLAGFNSLSIFGSAKDLMENTENHSSWKQFYQCLIDFICIKS